MNSLFFARAFVTGVILAVPFFLAFILDDDRDMFWLTLMIVSLVVALLAFLALVWTVA